MSESKSTAGALRQLLDTPGILPFPCVYDALSARLTEQAGFRLSFMSGFAVAAVRFGVPDVGLVSYGEMLEQGRSICESVSLPVIGDGDTGYGNAVNVKRTVRGYAAAGFAAVMIEDQVWPKRCGHTRGKSVVARDEAVARIRAACDARDEGADIMILARTDALGTDGLDEAIARANAFSEAGADMLFVEAPTSEDQMRAICERAPGHHLANMLEDGATPLLSDEALEQLGFKLIARPFSMLNAGIHAMQEALASLKAGKIPEERISFEELKRLAGFEDYYREDDRYRTDTGG